MKYYTFYREDNNFKDILSDGNLKKVVTERVKWFQHLMIGIDEHREKNDQAISYITIKYGDDMVNNLTKDFTPIPGVDYIPKKDASKFKKSIR